MKHFMMVTSPPACGKTFIAKALASRIENCVYLDKDSVIVLSKQIYRVGGQPFDRSSAFFEEQVRDYEYQAILGVAFEALAFNRCVLVNAPFTREIRSGEWMEGLRAQLSAQGAALTVVWVHTDMEVCRQRMIARNSERDTWKLAHWDEYVKGRSFSPPAGLPELLVVDNSTDTSYLGDVERLAARLLR